VAKGVVVVRSGKGRRFFKAKVTVALAPTLIVVVSAPPKVGVVPSVVTESLPAVAPLVAVITTNFSQEVNTKGAAVLAVRVPLRECTAMVHVQKL